jgi:AbrB family looped-hinge helix DNA binding protein
MQLVIDRFGRVVLPKAIRDDLGVGAGDILDVDERPDGIMLRPAHETAIVREKAGVLVFGGKAIGDLRAAVAEHRRSRIERASLSRTRR